MAVPGHDGRDHDLGALGLDAARRHDQPGRDDLVQPLRVRGDRRLAAPGGRGPRSGRAGLPGARASRPCRSTGFEFAVRGAPHALRPGACRVAPRRRPHRGRRRRAAEHHARRSCCPTARARGRLRRPHVGRRRCARRAGAAAPVGLDSSLAAIIDDPEAYRVVLDALAEDKPAEAATASATHDQVDAAGRDLGEAHLPADAGRELQQAVADRLAELDARAVGARARERCGAEPLHSAGAEATGTGSTWR